MVSEEKSAAKKEAEASVAVQRQAPTTEKGILKKEAEKAPAAKEQSQMEPAQKSQFQPAPQAQDDEKQKLLQLSEISLWLDNYDDIFSDFDSRPYLQRALSDDFLHEAKKASREKTSGVAELKFLVPAAQRNPADETLIKKRLHEHFKKHFNLLRAETVNTKKKGGCLVLVGFTLMLVATYLSYLKPGEFLPHFFLVVLEPAGWFMTWYGLDQIFYMAGQHKADLEFYEKMSKCNISFLSY